MLGEGGPRGLGERALGSGAALPTPPGARTGGRGRRSAAEGPRPVRRLRRGVLGAAEAGGGGGGRRQGRARGAADGCREPSVRGGAPRAGEGARALRFSAPHRFPARGCCCGGGGGGGGRRRMRAPAAAARDREDAGG